MLLSEVRLRNCLKSLASLKTNASKPTKQSKEGSFRCDMTAISALETLLSDFLDSFKAKFAEFPFHALGLIRGRSFKASATGNKCVIFRASRLAGAAQQEEVGG